MVAFVRNCLVKMTLRQFEPLFVVMNMVPALLKQFKRLLQIKRIIANAPRDVDKKALEFAQKMEP